MLTENFLRSRRRSELSSEEKAALEGAIARVERLPARRTIVERGDAVHNSTLLLSGFMCRYMDARDGYRQLVCYHIPGDFIDLHGYPLQRLDHDVATITEAEIAVVPHTNLTAVTDRFPHLGRMLWFSTLLDAALHREWIFRIGRLDARGRVAHFICETHARMQAVGLASDGVFDFPLTQQDIGEACGLTSVHVNRTLRRLREEGLAEVADRRARILDLAKLARLGEFESDYLYLEDEFHTP
ncbi:Crp/Fnr family transcriptional regulator [Sphingomonas koreensis]|nr:Crp/Fnr family transcriptional regulator [Sphingomonas koreensis]